MCQNLLQRLRFLFLATGDCLRMQLQRLRLRQKLLCRNVRTCCPQIFPIITDTEPASEFVAHIFKICHFYKTHCLMERHRCGVLTCHDRNNRIKAAPIGFCLDGFIQRTSDAASACVHRKIDGKIAREAVSLSLGITVKICIAEENNMYPSASAMVARWYSSRLWRIMVICCGIPSVEKAYSLFRPKSA